MDRRKRRIATYPQLRLDAVAKEFGTLPADVRAQRESPLGPYPVRAYDVGWGVG
jgi:hypothetical protein